MAGPDINLTSLGKKENIWEISSGLHKKTLIYFGLLILMAVLLSAVAIYHHSLTTVATEITTGTTATDQVPGEHHNIEESITYIAVGLVSILIVFMFFFIRNIISPLNKLEKLTREMADGRLDLLVHGNSQASRSIGSIGDNVNSLAMNLQEILLLVWNHSEHNLGTIEKTLEILADSTKDPDEIKTNLLMMKNELMQMQALAKQFELFDVSLEDKKALAKDDSVNP